MQGKLVTSESLLCFWEAEQRRCSRMLLVAPTLPATVRSYRYHKAEEKGEPRMAGNGHQLTSSVLLVMKEAMRRAQKGNTEHPRKTGECPALQTTPTSVNPRPNMSHECSGCYWKKVNELWVGTRRAGMEILATHALDIVRWWGVCSQHKRCFHPCCRPFSLLSA